MALYGACLKGGFATLVIAQHGYNSCNLFNPSINTIMHSNKRKFAGIMAAAKHNANNEHEELTRVKGIKQTTTIKYSGEKPKTSILDTINYPIHMKTLCTEDLEKLADELREEILYTVSKTGGHLSSSLGVVELTVSLHHVFDAPDDKIIWDVGHQSYPHKILTGRRSKMETIRQTCGLAGFPKRDESPYDAFGVGHSSTSI